MASTQALTPDTLLTTTRAVRKRLDFERPVPMAVIRECLEIALQAPSGSNRQGWHFVVVTDPKLRAGLAELYRRSFEIYRTESDSVGMLKLDDPGRRAQQGRVIDSVTYLAERFHEVPVHVIPCIEGRPTPNDRVPAYAKGSSIYPAAWSFMLAARARGLGTCLTALHLRYEREAADLLGIPYDQVVQVGLITAGYYTGEHFRPALRKPLDTVLHMDGW